jgi:hypothetical protein
MNALFAHIGFHGGGAGALFFVVVFAFVLVCLSLQSREK